MAASRYLESRTRWDCGSCLKRGLEKQRRCALLGYGAADIPVWAKEGAVYFQCPESLLDGNIFYWLSLEALLRDYPSIPWLEMPAVDCDAVQALWQSKGKADGKE